MIPFRRPQPMTRVPTVSVVIPHHNYGQYLPRCLASVLNQEDVSLEVIIVDDASTDGSLDVAKDLASRHSEVTLVTHDVNLRHIATYNDGLSRVSGDYVVLLSADDLLAPGSLARSTALMEAHQSVGLVYGYAPSFTDDPPPAVSGLRNWSVWSGEEWIAHVARRGRNIIGNPEAMMRASVLADIGGYDPAMPHSGDLYMWLQAAARSDVGRVNGPHQAYYRQHETNMHNVSFGGLLDDMTAVRHTFDTFFKVDGHRLADAQRLFLRCRRALAHEVLRNRSVLPRAEQKAADDLATFATETYPMARVSSRVHMGTIAEQSDRLRRAWWSFTWKIRWRRWRRFGT